MRLLFLLMALSALAAAGCAGPEDDEAPGPPENEPPTGGEPPRGLPRGPSVNFTGFDMSGCDVIWGTFDYPLGVRPWDLPSTWGETYLNRYKYLSFQCERISWGPHEPGPVHFLVGGPDASGAPRNCDSTDWQENIIITEFYIDDPNLGGLLAADFGWPVLAADVSYQRDTNGNLTEDTLTWQPQPGDTSTMVFNYPRIPDDEGHESWRFLWYNATTMSALDMEVTRWDVNPDVTVSYGWFGDPSPLAQSPMSQRPGGGGSAHKFSAQGEVTTWPNHECKSS